MNKVLEVEGLVKIFHRKNSPPVEVLRGISLSVGAGERVAILGRSGSGKSTLLHILGTLDSPTSGSVSFQGVDVWSWSEKRLAEFRNRDLGFVFQFHYLMLEFTALENVMIPALLGRVDRGTAKAKAEGLLRAVGLKDRFHHKPSQLSGGEQQRVAVARALILGPKLLLTDEMTGNLDRESGAEVNRLVMGLHKELGLSIVSVTHDEQLARQYDRVVRLEGGVVV